jgi:phytoene dehydrogenase-like protein
MADHVVVIGAGMGGLTAAIRLAQAGRRVTVMEARNQVGGLASGARYDGFDFDAGPYILLDRPGLEWAFERLQIRWTEKTSLERIKSVYEVHTPDDSCVRISDSLDDTVRGLKDKWPEVGPAYESFIASTQRTYKRLQPLQRMSGPGIADMLRTGAWRELPFLFKSLNSVLRSSRLPEPVCRALTVWTHVAGQQPHAAPSPLALVPGMIHGVGAWYPHGGIRALPELLASKMSELEVRLLLNTKVRKIGSSNGRVTGVETECGHVTKADAVVSDIGLATLMNLVDQSLLPQRQRMHHRSLPLQSPGVCVYLAVRNAGVRPYLTFRLFDAPDGCRLLVIPSAISPRQVSLNTDGWSTARLIAPMNHTRAKLGGETAQRRFLDQLLNEDWWRRYFADVRILATRIPMEWGTAFHLQDCSMNPVMTAKFMRQGRVAHRCPWISGLYLAGSATHPGQWVSFAAVSGILAANELLSDRRV